MVVSCLKLLLLCVAIIGADALPSSVKLPHIHHKVPTAAVAAVVAAVVLLLVVILVCCCLRCRCFPRAKPVYRNGANGVYRDDVYRNDAYRNDAYRNEAYRNDVYRNDVYRNEVVTSQNHSNGSQSGAPKANNKVAHELLDFENRQFSYDDLVKITSNFRNNIGTGGFGSVYVGALENGNKVAVKIRSHASSQGVKEFMAEAKNLTRVHHVNLVSLIGYCLDENCMALIYEYMPEGTLQDKLRDTTGSLSWKQRLRIAHESALGLEYLHKGCNPPLVHRDVKSNNILLNANLEAKISDFGLSRAFNAGDSTQIATAVVGTPGYLDPEYFSSLKLNQKSDVYSFGIVLLEIITGRPPIISGPQGGHLAEWLRKKLSRGNLDSIVDPRMQGQYDVNSVWKVIDLACKCTDNSSTQRPAMNVVVSELKESLDLEIATEGSRGESATFSYTGVTGQSNYPRSTNFISDVSDSSVSEVAYLGNMPAAPRPIAR